MSNKPSKGKIELLKFIKENNRIPTYTEAFDIYTDHVLKEQTECWMTVNGPTIFDKPLWRIQNSAWSWFKMTIGILVIEGKIIIKEENVI